MYDLEALKRLIAKKGLPATISYLQSTDLPSYLIKDLEEEQIFKNGKLCTDLSSIAVLPN